MSGPPEGTDSSLRCLSSRELQILEMTAQGLTNTKIAAGVGVSVHAVKFHLGSIYRKLGVANRTEAAGLYFRGRVNDADPVDTKVVG